MKKCRIKAGFAYSFSRIVPKIFVRSVIAW